MRKVKNSNYSEEVLHIMLAYAKELEIPSDIEFYEKELEKFKELQSA